MAGVYCKDVGEHKRRCSKCTEIKTFKQTKIHTWPKERTPWTSVHMDHAHIRDICLFFILVDSFSDWSEVIKVRDKKATTVRQILSTIFARNRVPKTIVTDNAPEFCDESLMSWLRKIGWRPYKTPPYQPQSNGIAERMLQTVKIVLKAFSPFNQNIEAYISNLLLSYRTVPHADRKLIPSALMSRRIKPQYPCHLPQRGKFGIKEIRRQSQREQSSFYQKDRTRLY